MSSAEFTINSQRLYLTVPAGFTASSGQTLTFALLNTAGVNSWQFTCIGVDGYDTTITPATVTASVLSTLNPVSWTCTVTLPTITSDRGLAWVFSSTVNGQATTYFTGGVFVPNVAGVKGFANNQTIESGGPIFGCVRDVNISQWSHIPTGPAGGDLSSSYPNPKVIGIDGYAISAKPNAGQTLQSDGTHMNPVGIKTVINVLAYGADPTATTFSDAAIKAAIDYADSLGGAEVYFPPGEYLTRYPIDRTGPTILTGAGSGLNPVDSTILGVDAFTSAGTPVAPYGYSGGVLGPTIYQHAGNNATLPTYTQVGNFWMTTIPGGDTRNINLSRNITGSINGWAQFTLEVFVHNINVANGGGVVCSSSGGLTTSTPLSKALEVTLTNQGSGAYQVGAKVTTTGTSLTSFNSGSNHFDGASLHKLAVSYDGSKARLFCDGYYVGGAAMSGTVAQGIAEDFILFGSVNASGQWPGNGLVSTAYAGDYGSIRLSNTARFTNEATNYGVETSVLPVDGYTVLLMDFAPSFRQDVKIIGGGGTNKIGGAIPGTFSVVNGSPTVTGTAYHPLVNQYIFFASQPGTIYQIASQGNYTITLTTNYTGTTNGATSAMNWHGPLQFANLPYNVFYDWSGFSNQCPSISLSNMFVACQGAHAIYLDGASGGSKLSNLQVHGGSTAITMVNNCYISEIDHIQIQGGFAPGMSCWTWGLGMLYTSGLARISNMALSNSMGWNIVVCNSSGGEFNKCYTLSREHGNYYINQSQCSFVNNFPTDEGGYIDTAGVLLNNTDGITFSSGEVQNFSSGLGACIVVDAAKSSLNGYPSSLTLDGVILEGTGPYITNFDNNTSYTFHVINGSTSVTASASMTNILSVGQRVQFFGGTHTYLLTGVSGTALTLDVPYQDSTQTATLGLRVPVALITTKHASPCPITMDGPNQGAGGVSPVLPWTDGYSEFIIHNYEKGKSNTITFTSDADLVLGVNDCAYGVLNLTDPNSVLTVNRNLLIQPLCGTTRTIINNTAKTITVKTAIPQSQTSFGSTSIAITTGSKAVITRYFKALTGTVTLTTGSATVTGSSTTFTTDCYVGQIVQFSSQTNPDVQVYVIQSITSDTSLTLATLYSGPVGSGIGIATNGWV